jgi:hypothetical protein
MRRRRVAFRPVALSSQQSFDPAPAIQKSCEIPLPICEAVESDQFLILFAQSSRFPAITPFCDPEIRVNALSRSAVYGAQPSQKLIGGDNDEAIFVFRE